MPITRQERLEILKMASHHNMGAQETLGRAKLYEEYLLKFEAVPESPKVESSKEISPQGPKKRADTVNPLG